ncbi:MAG: MFS transporter [Aeromicrobium sp.]
MFLGQYFQIAGGHSPTEAGLLRMPLMLGSFVGTVGSGRLITRTGKLKRYLVSGSSLLFVGLGLLGAVDHSTPEWHAMVFMALMGLGMGMLLQNYVLAVQNTVDVTDVGSASAAVAFFRSLGGTVGVSVLGAILADQVKTDVTGKLAAIGVPADGGGGGSLFNLKDMPAPVVHIIESAYGDAPGFIFMIAAAVSGVSLVTALLMKDVPLRTTVHKND